MYNFTLLVYADEIIKDPDESCEQNDSCNIIDTDTWEGKIIEEDGIYHPDAPIPTISYVSPSGLVTISWDREMQIPE